MRKLKAIYRTIRPPRVLNHYPEGLPKPRGSVLVSYLSTPLTWKPDDRRFLGHSHCWESVEIVRILNALGFSADVINWDDTSFAPAKSYDAILDIHRNLTRYGGGGEVKILHVTTADPGFSNQAARRRVADLEARRGGTVAPRRSFSEEEVALFHRNLAAADIVTLLGNEPLAATFPQESRHKIRLVPVTGSMLQGLRNPWETRFGKEFLWYGGVGAVHKGLDLTLEAFARHSDLTLHVVGPYLGERDFIRLYRHELTRCPNIRSHGYLYPSDAKFRALVAGVRAFILPSCSESTSSAAVTCMQYGLLPVVSEECGLDLARDRGITLRSCAIDEIEQTVISLGNAPEEEIRQMTARAQEYALTTHSREAFTERMRGALATVLA